MHAIGKAIKYCYYVVGEVFYRPRLLLMLFFFLLESLLATGLALALSTIVIHFLGLGFWGLFLIGVVMALFLFVFYYLYQLLKARTIAVHEGVVDQSGQRLKLPGLAWPVLGYTFQHLVSWRDAGKLNWQNGKHLMLPLMVKYRDSFGGAYRRLQDLKLNHTLRLDPHLVAARPLTMIFCLAAIFAGMGLGVWLGFAAASGIVVPFIRRVQAIGLALLVFLAISWLPLALSAVKNGLYQADLLSVELADQPGYMPELLANVFGGRS